MRSNPPTLPPESLKTIEEIKSAIIAQYNNKNINDLQLTNILNLIKDTARLKELLPFL